MTDTTQPRYKVVLNDEDQYSIWPAERPNPAGWRDEGAAGTREQCLDHIGRVWTDMRPRSVRERLTASQS
jgi:MbtH protein